MMTYFPSIPDLSVELLLPRSLDWKCTWSNQLAIEAYSDGRSSGYIRQGGRIAPLCVGNRWNRCPRASRDTGRARTCGERAASLLPRDYAILFWSAHPRDQM